MDLQEIKRKNFRIKVHGNDNFSLKINNLPYDIIDIGNNGIGIKLTSEDIFFTVGDELPIELKAENQTYTFQGKVLHINPIGPEDFLCGMQFINPDAEMHTKWMNFLKSFREKMFSDE